MNNIEAKIISIDIKASFGFFKKFDINEDIYLTYNCLHKPALLGIFGAIIGLKGYYQAFIEQKKRPEYFELLKDLKIGIEPLNSSNGNFQKTVIVYNNSVGYASEEVGGNLIVKEQTLIYPSYRIYILLDKNEHSQKLFRYLKNHEAEFIPYLGKNDFQISWENLKEYELIRENTMSQFQIASIFIKNEKLKDYVKRDLLIDPTKSNQEKLFFYFERLPIGFSEITGNYELAEFVFTNAKFDSSLSLSDLYVIKGNNNNEIKKIIQVF